MRQARRAYRHLPAELHEQAFDQAAVAMRTRAPSSLDRRTLYADLAAHLDDALRRIHVGWCLNQARATEQTATVDSVPHTQQTVSSFLEDGLGGLERAVLQLELGAGRDTSTVRAALRLGPRQYARHREVGLGKLRGVISGGLSGRVCDQHLDAVTLAATGDREAADRLASGPGRCRACAREASGLRRVLQQRLALAPWPLAIKPAGAIAAKVGAIGAIFGGNGMAGSGAASTASGAKAVASLMATAAIASGGIAAVESDAPAPEAPAAAVAAPAATNAVGRATAPASRTRASASEAESTAAAARRDARTRRARRARPNGPAPAISVAASPQAQAGEPAAAGQAPATPAKPTGTVRQTVDEVKRTVDAVTEKLPVPVPPVDELVPGAADAADGLTGTVDGVLAP